MSGSIKLKHASGNGVIIAAPSSNPSSDKTINLPSDETGIFATKDSNDSLQNISSINGNSLRARNLIDNGAMQIKQRAEASGNTVAYLIDRFYMNFSGTDEAPTQSRSDVASGTTPYSLGFRKALKITNGNQTNGAGAADFINITHVIESANVVNSGWNYNSTTSFVSFSFWLKSSVSQRFYVRMLNLYGTLRVFNIDTGIVSANTWTKVTAKIPGNADLTFADDNLGGLQFQFIPFYGTDYTDGSSPIGSWYTSTNSTQIPDMTSTWYTTNDATFEITGVQLEVGPKVTEFMWDDRGIELAKCMRYYQELSRPRLRGLCGATTAFNRAGVALPVRMRTGPTATIVGTLDFFDGTVQTVTTQTASYVTVDSVEFDGSFATGTATAGRPAICFVGANTGKITLRAEL